MATILKDWITYCHIRRISEVLPAAGTLGCHDGFSDYLCVNESDNFSICLFTRNHSRRISHCSIAFSALVMDPAIERLFSVSHGRIYILDSGSFFMDGRTNFGSGPYHQLVRFHFTATVHFRF
jgi:hypothetical protein